MTRRLLLLALTLTALVVLTGPSPAGARAAEGAEGNGALTQVAQVDSGQLHACARLTTGRVKCWGEGGAGRLGRNGIADDGVAGFVLGVGGTGQLTGATQLSVGSQHSCVRLENGQARCWGENGSRQLGNGETQDGGPHIVQNRTGGTLTGVRAVAAGEDHTCAIVGGGQVRCWGNNVNGELGDGTIQPRTRPVTVLDVNGTGPLTGATQITAGVNYTCARLNTGQARCWGHNTSGQLGRGNSDSRARPVVVKNGGNTGPLTNVTQISAGFASTCARSADGSARCWGNGGQGVLGNGDDDVEVLPVRVRGVGGVGFLGGVTSISVGQNHACATVTGGQARCWGDGGTSALGNSESNDSFTPVVVRNVADTGALVGATQAAAGGNFSCARLNNDQARCWGRDDEGQLGHNDAGPSNVPVVVEST